MSQLSSRPPSSPATPSDTELPEMVDTTGVRVKVTVDKSVDPPMLIVSQEAVPPFFPAETLLFKQYVPLTLADLMQVINRLGYPVDFEELR